MTYHEIYFHVNKSNVSFRKLRCVFLDRDTYQSSLIYVYKRLT